VKYIRIHVHEYTEQIFASNLPQWDRKPKHISKFLKIMVVMASDGPSPSSPSLFLGLIIPQPSRRHHAQSLLGPLFHDPRTPHVLESHPEQAAPLSRRDDEWRHAICSHSALALHLCLAVCSSSSSYRFWVLDHLFSNLSESFHSCWITEIRSLNLCVRFYPFLFCLCFPDRSELQL